MNKLKIEELQKRIYKQNVEMGWWDNPRSFETFICLFHSELSEAMEGDRKNLMDDHLPQYLMFWVEISDFVIRVMDWLGSKKFYEYDNLSSVDPFTSKINFLVIMHMQVTGAYEMYLDPYYFDKGEDCSFLAWSVVASFKFADSQGIDLLKIIDEKVEYNKHRKDHKKENREKINGKKY